MSLTIPDNDEITYPAQAWVMQTDINALVAGIAADGVLTGCAVTAQGTPDMTVAVAAGEIVVAGVKAIVAAGNVTITTADASNPRIDLVVVNSSGTKSVTAGTAAAQPKAADIPASSVLLAMVYVPANATTVGALQIVDKRVVVATTVNVSPLSLSGTAHPTLPGVAISTTATAGMTANQVRYYPIEITTPRTIAQLMIEVTTAGAASTTARVALYHAQPGMVVGSLIVDSGPLATDSTGVKSATVNVTLQPGWYFLAYHGDGTPTLRSARGVGREPILAPNLNSALYVNLLRTNTVTYGAFPTTPTAIAVAGTANTPFEYVVFVRYA